MPLHKLAFCITDLDAGGAERALVELVTRLDPGEWERRVYCLGDEGVLAPELRDHGIEVQCLGARSVWDIGILGALSRSLREYRPQLLQSFLFHANVLGRLAGRRAQVPVIVSGLRVAEREQRWHVWVDRATGVGRHHAVCVSDGVAEFARTALKIPPQQIHVVPNGVDCDRFAQASPLPRSALGLPERSTLIVAVGRLHPQKGFDLLIDAAAPLLRRRDDLFVVIAGEGPQRSALQRQIDRLHASQQVRLIGRCEEIPRLLKGADLFVLSSRWEGMPNVLLEAAAAGVPVVSADVEGVREVLGERPGHRIFAPNSVAELGAAICWHLEHSEEGHREALALQDVVCKRFTLSACCRAYEALYRHLLANLNSCEPG